jgi:toxin ParE1/3/4
MEYRLSSRAKTDIADIYFYGSERWGERQADQYYLDMLAAFEEITKFPLSCRERPDVEAGIRIWIFHSHLIVYELQAEIVVVLRVVHGHHDWQNDL